jgi:DNA-binding CsgD family transcriptional regulator
MAIRPCIPLVGRDQVLERLLRSLDVARGGIGGCLIIEGPPGIGKSRLLLEAAREAEALDMVVASAQATELDRIAPLTTLLMALRGCQPAVVDSRCMADLCSLGSHQGNAFWLVNQLSLQIEEYAAARALVISLDDVQWADELTALALRILVPTLSSSPVLWLLASRPLTGRSPAGEVLGWLADEGAPRLTLEPLSDESVVAMSTEILGASPNVELRALARRTGGNPFLLEQLLDAYRSGRPLRDERASEVGDDVNLPVELVKAVDLRLRSLSRGARQVLDTGAVLGRVFTVPEVAAVIGVQPGEIHDAVTELVDEGVLVGTGSKLEFQHDLIRDAVYGCLTESVKQALHGEAGKVLLGRSRPVTEVATHLLRGARNGDATTIALLRDAALDLAATAPNTAADLMLQVLALLDDRDPVRPSLVATTVRLLASASRLAEARELGEAALRFPLAEEAQAAMLLGLAEALKHAGQNVTAVEYTCRALSGARVPAALRTQLLAVQAHALGVAGDIDGSDHAAAQAVEVGTACGEHSAVVFAAVARSRVAQHEGRIADAISLAGEAVQLADFASGEARHRHPRLWLGRALAAGDRFAEAEALYELGEREARESGAVWSLPVWHLYRAELKLAAGNLDDAEAEAESGVAVAEQLSAQALTPSLLGLLTRVAVQRGELSAAEEHLRLAWRSMRTAADEMSGEPNRLTWTHAFFTEATGDAEAAVRILVPMYAVLSRHPMQLTLTPSAGPYMVRLALRAGDVARARMAASAANRLFERNPRIATLAGAAAQAEGLLHGDQAALCEAVHRFETSPRRLERASALEDAGVGELAAGGQARAVQLLEQAHELYSASGARRDAARVDQRLRALGIRRRSRRGQSRAKEGVDSLTESERRVVTLVAEGLTNRAVAERLFLSPHTVDAHLRHSFTKLGVSSRVELTRALLLHKSGEELR